MLSKQRAGEHKARAIWRESILAVKIHKLGYALEAAVTPKNAERAAGRDDDKVLRPFWCAAHSGDEREVLGFGGRRWVWKEVGIRKASFFREGGCAGGQHSLHNKPREKTRGWGRKGTHTCTCKHASMLNVP